VLKISILSLKTQTWGFVAPTFAFLEKKFNRLKFKESGKLPPFTSYQDATG